MGLSLRNLGKKITDFAGGVAADVNPFDHGASHGNRMALPRPSGPAPNTFNPNVSLPGPLQRPTVFNANPASNIADVKRFNVNNPHASGGGTTPYTTNPVVNAVIRPILRTGPELATLVTHKDYHPGSGIQQGLFGKEPVQTFTEREKGLQKTFQNKGGVVGHLATPLAVAGTGANIGLDASVVAPAIKAVSTGAKVGVKVAAPVIKDASASTVAAAKAVKDSTIPLNEKGFIAGPRAIGYNEAKKAGVTFKGPDKAPRFEVDDSKVKIPAKQANGKTFDIGSSYRLDEVLHHPKLYQQYPFLKNTKVSIKDSASMPGIAGSFDGKSIHVNADLNNYSEELKSTLLHEVQHAIQKEEKFATGGSVKTIRDLELGKISDKALDLQVKINELKRPGAVQVVRSGEEHPLTKLMRDQEKLMSQWQAVSSGKRDDKLFNLYHRLAGEAESRNVETRMNLSEAGRATLPFDKTMDVPKNKLIVTQSNFAAKVAEKPKLNLKQQKVIQDKLTKLQGKAYSEGRPMTKAEQIKEGMLMEQLHGKPKVALKGQAPKTPPVDKPPKYSPSIGPVRKDGLTAKILPIDARLKRMGGAHKDLADVLISKRNLAEKNYAAAKADSPAANSLNEKEFSQAVDALESNTKHKNPRINQAVVEMKTQLDKVHNLATQYGIKVNKRQNYFPHFNDIPKRGDGGYQAAIDHLIKTKQAKTPGEASQLLEYSRQAGGQRRFANFEKDRHAELPDYAKTVGAYHHYLEGAHQKIADALYLGPKDEKLNAILNAVHDQGGDLEKVRGLFNRGDSRHLYDPTHEKISSALTTLQGGTKLGTSFIGNAAQQGNNIIAGGVGRTLVGAGKLAKKGERAFVERTGVTGEGVARESIESRTGLFNKGFNPDKNVVRKVTAPFFEPVEKANRAVGAITGRDQARTIAGRFVKARAAGKTDKAARLEQQLRDKFNIQGKIGDKLTLNQEIDAAREFVHRTQFRTGAQDLPAGATSPIGRVVTQFKRYPYKQTGFIAREILKPLAEGNPLPLVRAVGTTGTAGYGLNTARNKITGRDTSQDSTATRIADISQAGGTSGIETSLARGLSPGGSKDSNAYGMKAIKTVGGPTTSDVLNLGKAGFNAATDKKNGQPSRFTDLERFTTQHIPDVGQSISNRVLPYPNSKVTLKNGKVDPNATTQELDAASKPQIDDFKKTAKPGDYRLDSLPNGKFVISVDGRVSTKDTLKEARQAIAKDSFQKGDVKKKIVGDTVYYKKPDGTVKTKSKVLYDFEQTDARDKLEMDRAYEAKDLNKWLALADKQVGNLEAKKKLYDPETEQDEIDKIELQEENLKQKAEKYLEKGINGSKGSGRGKKDSPFADVHKYDVSIKSSGGAKPRVSVRAPSIRAAKGGSAAKRPSYAVKLKKSRV